MNKLIILRGYPGSGKTTIGKLLEKECYGKFLDHNAILAFIASIVGDDKGIYKNIIDLEIALTKKLLTENKTVIVARGFGRVTSMTPYFEIADRIGAKVYVVTLEASLLSLEQRVITPEREQQYNPTTTTKSLHQWTDDNPLQAFNPGVVVNADLPIQEVLDSIKNLLESEI